MMNFARDIKVLHLEPTDVCQAACPACARETDALFNKNSKHHLSVDQIKSIFSIEDIQKLDKMFMCGNYGDPAAGKHTVELYEYFRSINPNITLGMNTNGGLQNTNWWAKVGTLLSKHTDYAVFSIDGLEDTNHIYRIGVDWRTVIRNIKSYISAGGNAQWDMLVYKHNEHQVKECEKIAKDMGFTCFRAKVSKRKLTNNLESPINWQLPKVAVGSISCIALEQHSMYVDSNGTINPCCWLGTSQKTTVDFKTVQESWNNNPNNTCATTCRTNSGRSNFTGQWQHEVQFKCN
jgi:MoaA/NifB/PqqE/SkfB family radical SAM enzyme